MYTGPVRIHHEELTDVERYIQRHGQEELASKESEYQTFMRLLEPYKKVDSTTSVLEIGTGTGWFPLLCKQHGVPCKGLEISPQLVDHAKELGQRTGLIPDIELGNIEESDIGGEVYDVIVASSVFEHVEHWRPALKRVYAALRPGGVLYFESTNKFCPKSGEYDVLFYSWLPDAGRYWLRRKVHGDDVMKLGIDFNQFRYPLLRREFKKLGFSQIYDRVDLADLDHVSTPGKARIAAAAKSIGLVRALALTFCDVTRFVCVKPSRIE